MTFTEQYDLSTTRARVSLPNLLHNLSVFQDLGPDVDVIGVVKANAYGHGSIEISKTLILGGVRTLAVANVSEAIELREAGVESRIIVFGAPRRESIQAYPEYDLELFVTGLDSLEIIRSVSGLKIHVLVDTGMARLGISAKDVPRVLREIEAIPNTELKAISTHFASAGQPNSPFAREQWLRFKAILDKLGSKPAEIHIASSGSMFTVPESIDPGWVDSARVGIGLYGLLDPIEGVSDTILKPVMTLESEVARVAWIETGAPVSYNATWRTEKRTQIATIAAGYADGYPRILSNQATVGIRGEAYPVVGAVCMDLFMVDIGHEPGIVSPGECVTLFGPGGPSAMELARLAQTIPYELVCGIGPRVPRIYEEAKTVNA